MTEKHCEADQIGIDCPYMCGKHSACNAAVLVTFRGDWIHARRHNIWLCSGCFEQMENDPKVLEVLEDNRSSEEVYGPC